MSIFNWLKGVGSSPATTQGDTETVRRIMGELDRLDPKIARYLAAFAYVLGRVANADLEMSDTETEKMVDLVQQAGQLPIEQALLVVEIAKRQNRLFGGTEDFLVTRELRNILTDEQRSRLLDCLFAVAAADEEVSGEEEEEIRQIASGLGFEHADYIRARLAYTAKRTIFRKSST